MENQTGQAPKRNSNIIYFLIVVVLALLATDVYLYLQKNKSDKIVVTQGDERTRLQTELDSLEAQIEQVNVSKTKMSVEMQAKNDLLQQKINILRKELAKGKLTQAELDKAKDDIRQLSYSVTTYTAQIDSLKKQNTSLAIERDTLKTRVRTAVQKDSVLSKQNADLGAKVKTGSAIKLAEANIVAYKIKPTKRLSTLKMMAAGILLIG